MTKLSKAAFLSKYASIFADNVTRDISEEDVRDFRQDISDSFLSIDDNFIDEDSFTSDSATKAPSQQSTKAYVDGAISGIDDFWPLTGSGVLTGDVEIDGQSMFGITLGGDGFTSDPLDFFNVSADTAILGASSMTIAASPLTLGGHVMVTADNFDFKTDQRYILWFEQTIGAGASQSDRDIFDTYEDAQATIIIKAVGVKNDGSEGYSAIKIYDFRKDGSANPSLEGELPLYENGAAEADVELSVAGSSIRLLVTTPTGDTYKWKVYAEVIITEV